MPHLVHSVDVPLVKEIIDAYCKGELSRFEARIKLVAKCGLTAREADTRLNEVDERR